MPDLYKERIKMCVCTFANEFVNKHKKLDEKDKINERDSFRPFPAQF